MNLAYHMKYTEIQDKFIEGCGDLVSGPFNHEVIATGLMKLWGLKVYYEQQLEDCQLDPLRIEDVEICFKCFEKGPEPCTDCD